jgi:hypothetical protein
MTKSFWIISVLPFSPPWFIIRDKLFFLCLWLLLLLTKEIYEADVGGNAERGRPRRTFLDQIGELKGRARSRVPETGDVYEEFDDSGRSERCV